MCRELRYVDPSYACKDIPQVFLDQFDFILEILPDNEKPLHSLRI